LHNQIRIMVGSLAQVGLGKQDPEWIWGLLQRCDRTLAGPTAPAHGLYFAGVSY
ncbi:MAG: tRNA pseudouridine(38-40) synthase TruA, partial [Alphaproteobacteria bacterium]|nr:tRNA pseudouridine(38-40) synthase TruA [Alphaproteobacteria bacterium]